MRLKRRKLGYIPLRISFIQIFGCLRLHLNLFYKVMALVLVDLLANTALKIDHMFNKL